MSKKLHHSTDNPMGQLKPLASASTFSSNRPQMSTKTSLIPQQPSSYPNDPFWNLVDTARYLQGPQGCLWDRQQTFASLLPHLLEEVWELFCAHRGRRNAHLEEELGDVLYTTLFLSLIAERHGRLTLESLLRKTRKKMIRRHPHVFGVRKARTATEAYSAWQQAKRTERNRAPSQKQVKPLLLELWQTLLARRDARRVLEHTLATLRRSRSRR